MSDSVTPASMWAAAVLGAIVSNDDGFHRASAVRDSHAPHDAGSQSPTRSLATLRAWIYRDVHVRPGNAASSYLGYGQLPVSPELRNATVRTSGWREEAGQLVNDSLSLTIARSEAHPDGFVHDGDIVYLPRLRCGTAPGWLTVAGGNGQISRASHRLYLPGVDLDALDRLVRALDLCSPHISWSLKSSVGIDRDGLAVPRADRTVIYVERPRPQHRAAMTDFLDTISRDAPAADGPGFSVPLRPGIWFGGPGREHGSYGTKIASIAAQALLEGDLSTIEHAESHLRQQTASFEAGGA